MLFIVPSVATKMIKDTETDLNECCGFLFGHQNREHRTITKSLAVINSKTSDRRTGYEITSEDFIDAELMAENENLDFLGIYHTHPNHSAIPSDYDQQMALPCFSYIIISVMNEKFNSMRSWQLDSQFNFKEEKIDFMLATN
ncbi:MAG TPA: M67 family metallopeptidase [Cyclobacteriaceae bacterium]|jgi:proteasome lid subunit RPN8/RPN11|nr:M67 family metallopeptidase [Cyclobacteriaceae bacterium]